MPNTSVISLKFLSFSRDLIALSWTSDSLRDLYSAGVSLFPLIKLKFSTSLIDTVIGNPKKRDKFLAKLNSHFSFFNVAFSEEIAKSICILSFFLSTLIGKQYEATVLIIPFSGIDENISHQVDTSKDEISKSFKEFFILELSFLVS
jgi:hypothetical protein